MHFLHVINCNQIESNTINTPQNCKKMTTDSKEVLPPFAEVSSYILSLSSK